MRGLYVEMRLANGVDYTSKDIASYLHARLAHGKVAVVTDQPQDMLRSIREQWRQMPHERPPTFNAQSPSEDPQADIHFSTAQAYRQTPPVCRTLYVTCEVSRRDMYMITSWMPPQSLVVLYKKKDLGTQGATGRALREIP